MMSRRCFPSPETRFWLWATLLTGSLLLLGGGLALLEEVVARSSSSEGKTDSRIVYAKPFITADNSQFGAKIEGTSVDGLGRVYAVDFGDKTYQLGRMSNEKGEVDQTLFFKSDDWESYFNGIRFFPASEKQQGTSESTAVVADKKGQIVEVLITSREGIGNGAGEVVTGRVFCQDERMIEPNDVAVAYKSGRVYSSGLNYVPDTSHGDGDLWMCETKTLQSPNLDSGPVAKATRLNVQGRANGIEVSNDEKHFYAAETWAKDMKIYSNILWKYDIDQETGRLSNKRLFFDMKEVDEELQGKAGDIDGVRTDMAGNLFLVRNGEPGEVVKVSPEGVIVKRIKLPGITEPTNIELGGPKGTCLFIVGKCKEMSTGNVQMACIDVWDGNDAPGRAFHNLIRPVTRHEEL